MYLLIISGLAGVLYGLASGNLLAVAMPYLERTMNVGAWWMSTLVASFSVVAIFSGFAAGPLADWWGRKKVLLLASIVFVASTPVVLASGFLAAHCGIPPHWTLVTGLGLQGLSMGFVGTVAPLYLAECLPPEHRGKGTGLFQLFLIGGIALSGFIGLAVASWFGAGDAAEELVSTVSKTRAWQCIFLLGALPSVALFLGGLALPESPEWLRARAGNRDGAAANDSPGEGTWAKLKMLGDRRYVVPFLIVLLIVSCNKLCGLPYVLCYSVKIFQSCGLGGAECPYANYADATFKVVMFAMTALACVLVDRKGRKFLLAIGTIGVTVSMAVIGATFCAIEQGLVPVGLGTGFAVAAAATLFIAAYSVGPGVCVWLVMTEVLPAKIRAIGMSVILLVNHFISSSQQWTFLPLGEKIGYAPIFLFCAASSAIYFLAVKFGMPETKGKSLEEIEAWYRRT